MARNRVALLLLPRLLPKQTSGLRAKPARRLHQLVRPRHIFKSQTEKLVLRNPLDRGPHILKCQTAVAVASLPLNLGVRSQRKTSSPTWDLESAPDKKSCLKLYPVKNGTIEHHRKLIISINFESRYVQELAKMKDTFIDPLLHPFSTSNVVSPLSSTPNLDYDYFRSESPSESNDHLPPIAARFMSPTPTMDPPGSGPSSIRKGSKDTPNIDGESLDTDEEDEGDDQIGRGYPSRQGNTSKHNHPRSPYRATATRTPNRTGGGGAVPFPSRSHQSLPPMPRANQLTASTHSLGRQSTIVERERERNYSQGQSTLADRKGNTPLQKPGMLRKFKKSQTSSDSIFGSALAPHQLPEDLRICLEVVDSGVFDGHKRLSEALKKRYDDQFPLVRSLADVFVSNVSIVTICTQ
jgi:hypothetical protein